MITDMSIKNLHYLDNNTKTDLYLNFNEYLEIEDLQLYFPTLLNITDNENIIQNDNYTLKSKYILEKIASKIESNEESDKQKSPYIKRIFNSTVLNTQTNKKETKEIFIKINPLIDVIQYLITKHKENKNILLPNYENSLLVEEINDFNNEAYIDAYFSYLASKMTENGKCPTFPLFYGTFSSIINNFKYDITEDYSMIKTDPTFKDNLNKLYNLEKIEIDDSDWSTYKSNISSDEELTNDLINEIKNQQSQLKDILESSEWDNDTLNHVECSSYNSSDCFSNISCEDKTFKYSILNNFPVQLNILENLTETLDDLIDNKEYEITEDEWISILFQICFGLSVAQKKYNFIHNDLHSSNIMFKNTQELFLYFEFEKKIFKIPTFGKITKIIDFARGIFNVQENLYFSNVFNENGDAEGQYTYPESDDLSNLKIKPNFSFDLARLSTTVIEHFKDHKSPVFKLLKSWIIDKNGYCLINEEDTFDLYVNIAKNVKNAVPKKQINKHIFKKFIIKKTEVPNNVFIYKY